MIHQFYEELFFRVGSHRLSDWREILPSGEAHCVIYHGTEAPASVSFYLLLADHHRGYVSVSGHNSPVFDVRNMRHTVDVVIDMYKRVFNGRYEGPPMRY